MNELNEQVKELKNSIFKITEHLNDSESNNQILAFKKFVHMSLQISFQTFLDRYGFCGVSEENNAPCNFQNCVSLGKEFLIFDDTDNAFDKSNIQNVMNAVQLYADIVKSNEPFTDVMSALAEEICLSHGRGTEKGQFITPWHLSQSLSELMNPSNLSDEPDLFADVCAGYGSLMLAKMNRQYKTSRKSLKQLRVIANDVDPLACNVSALQVLMNTVQHDIDISAFTMYCSDLIKDWSEEKPFVISYKTPQCVFNTFDNIREERLKASGYYDIF